MNPSELIFSHRVDKAFLTSGFVISKNDVLKNRDYLTQSINSGQTITIVFNGEKHSANFDHVREDLYRMMFRTSLKKAYQDSFTDCYDRDGADNITTNKNIFINVGFFATSEADVFEAKQIGKTIVVNIDEMKSKYEDYLNHLDGAFTGYIKAIDKKFVQNKVKALFELPSAYFITDPDDVLLLVKEIRSDPDTNEKDYADARRPSCSLKKYADFLIVFNKELNTMPFQIDVINEAIKASGLIFNPKFVERYVCSLLTKPFVILSGLTGSGKTQLAMAFPKLICKDSSQYKLIPVGADWTNREQLQGYPNALRPGEYVMPDNGALQLILEASKPENQDKPYFLVLDEMNMSYVERYFADFLSAMESGEAIPLWSGNDKVPATITLPKNLFIIGTINVDETTYMFSPKVLDRANVIEFRINKEQMMEYLDGTGTITKLENCCEQAADFVVKANKEYAGSLSAEMKTTLIDMFDTLGKIQKEFGYRTAHEMSRYITITKCFTEMSDNESIDSAIVQKLLPKVHGSRKKVTPVLKALWAICYNAEAVEIDTLEALPEASTFKYPLTAEKIWRMFQIAQDNGFTSFAEA